MEVLSPSATVSTSHHFSFPPHKPHFKSSAINIKFLPSPSKNNKFSLPSTSHLYSTASPRRYATVNLASTSSTSTSTVWSPAAGENRHWMVLMEAPPRGVTSKPEVVDYYVKALERVLGRWVFLVFSTVIVLHLFFFFSLNEFCFDLTLYGQREGCSDVYLWCFLG